jgi:tetratricopeptide (TPR) repeat protein
MSQDYDVFISYNRTDRDRVRLLKEEIRRLGLSVWMDEEIEPGTEFQREIEQALHNSGCVLVAWTEGSVASDWVRAEATAGFDKQRLISVRLDDVQVPLPFNIHDVADLTDWPSNHESDSRELQRLLGRITALLGRKQSTRQPAPKNENLSVRLARRVVQAISQTRATRRELQLRPQLPAAIYAKLTRTNALIDQMSLRSLDEARELAVELVTDLPDLDDGWIALVRSGYLAQLLDDAPASDKPMVDPHVQRSGEAFSVAALTSGDPQQVDVALTERLATPDDQSLLLFALYVLFPAGLAELGQKFLNAAESVNPLSAEIKFHLARSYGWLGDWSHCLSSLQDALRMSPDAEIVILYLALVQVRIGSYEAASATLRVHRDELAEPARAVLDSLIANRSSDQAGLFQDRLDGVLASLETPARSVAEILSNAHEEASTSQPMSDRWLFDVARRAEGHLKLVS